MEEKNNIIIENEDAEDYKGEVNKLMKKLSSYIVQINNWVELTKIEENGKQLSKNKVEITGLLHRAQGLRQACLNNKIKVISEKQENKDKYTRLISKLKDGIIYVEKRMKEYEKEYNKECEMEIQEIREIRDEKKLNITKSIKKEEL